MNNNFGLIDLFFFNKKYFRIIGFVTISVFILSIVYSLVSQPLYKSYISIYPTRNENIPMALSGFNNASSAFGFNFGNESNAYNIPDIINSRKLKKAIVSKEWETYSFENPIDLIRYWEIGKPSFMSQFFGDKESSEMHLQNIAVLLLYLLYFYTQLLSDINYCHIRFASLHHQPLSDLYVL